MEQGKNKSMTSAVNTFRPSFVMMPTRAQT